MGREKKRQQTVCLAISVFLFLSGCAPRAAIRKDYDFRKIRQVAVLSFDSSQVSFLPALDPGNAIADEFVFQLIERGITVVERSRLSGILREQELAKSGLLDADTVKQIGRLLGVDALITGTVTKYVPDRKERFYIKDEQGDMHEEIFVVDAEVAISARMIDVETGIIVWAGAYSYDSFYIDSAIRYTVSALLDSLKKFWF